ncbi:MAG: glycosyltransferase family 4 protein [Chitinophagaceae bacterium]|nr:glycosyltransferase family 4 protein [Chitinophagaceae bacterium]
MKIAILSPVAWRTPPHKYGPWEQVASNLTEQLVSRGLDVTLFATGDSATTANLVSVCRKGYAEDADADAKVNECLHISLLMERAGEYDIIHNHFDFLPLTYSRLIATPMITTIHGFSSPRIVPVYKKYNDRVHYVSISNSDRHPDLEYLSTVYNGIATQQFTYRAVPADYLLFFGRIHPEKGTLEAIEIAKRSGKKIIIAGLIQDQLYFTTRIQPLIDHEQVVYAGNCGPAERDELLGGALALLHPILFNEPFGLSVAEAMCSGTPVIAFNKGSMPELVVDNKTGFLVESVSEAASAVERVKELDRKHCREWAVKMFSKETMADRYADAYLEVLNNTR